MHKIIMVILSAVICCIAGCSSKTVTYTHTGAKNISTVTDASKYSDAQAEAWAAYYLAAANPPVIAKITQPDGTVVDIHSQVPPPTPDIKQHKNQVIEPVMGAVKTGIQIIGGGLVVREIVDSMQGVNINNSGSGGITYDRSETVSMETTTVDGGTIKDNSDNPETVTDTATETVTEDNHIENADPVIVEKETVKVVEPEVYIVDPSYPPVNE